MEWMSEADAPWNPKLVDILYKAAHGDADERAYYSKFGLAAAVWNSRLTNLSSHREEIIMLFNERYADRMVNRETLEKWQTRLQYIMDTEAPRYDRAFNMYNSKVTTGVTQKETVTFNNLKDQLGGTDTSKNTMTDTPDAIVNDSDGYADSVAKNRTDYGRTSTRSGSFTTEHDPEGGTVELVNANIDAYRNIMAEFVGEFDKLFMKVYWY